MRWNDLSQFWQIAFSQAWEAYCHGTLPIGAVIIGENGEMISVGRNRINEQIAPSGQIAGNKLAHAEMNALLQLKYGEHPNSAAYTLYTTMEPCPLCFGAIVMSQIGKVIFAARDRVGGGTMINETTDFIKSRQIKITGPIPQLEALQLAIKSEFILRNWPTAVKLLPKWEMDSPSGVKLGRELFVEGTLEEGKEQQKDAQSIVGMILERLSI